MYTKEIIPTYIYVLLFFFFLFFFSKKEEEEEEGRRKLRLSRYLTFEERKRERARKQERARERFPLITYLQYLNTLGKQLIDQASHLKLHLKLKTSRERALSRVDRI